MAIYPLHQTKELIFSVEEHLNDTTHQVEKLSHEHIQNLKNILHIMRNIQLQRLCDVLKLAPAKELTSSPLMETIEQDINREKVVRGLGLHTTFHALDHYNFNTKDKEAAQIILKSYINKTEFALQYKDKKRAYRYNVS